MAENFQLDPDNPATVGRLVPPLLGGTISFDLDDSFANSTGKQQFAEIFKGKISEFANTTNLSYAPCIVPDFIVAASGAAYVYVFEIKNIGQRILTEGRICPKATSPWRFWSNVNSSAAALAPVLREDENAQTERSGYTERAQLFKSLVNAPSKSINSLFEHIRRNWAAHDILKTSLGEYRRTGVERYLSIGVSLLKSMERAALPALRKLSEISTPEAELFLPMIARNASLTEDERLALLLNFAKSARPAIRLAVLDSLDDLPNAKSKTIFQILAADQEPEIRERAREYLELFQ